MNILDIKNDQLANDQREECVIKLPLQFVGEATITGSVHAIYAGNMVMIE